MDHPTFSSVAPEIWGRSFWEFLDTIVATFPKDHPTPEHRIAVYDLMLSLRSLLPCPNCRRHYVEFINRNNLDNALISRKTFVEFYFLLKRDIAMRTHKNFLFKNPDELFINITRRLKLTKPGPINTTANAQANKNSFRVPTRVRVNAPSAKLKGCACGK